MSEEEWKEWEAGANERSRRLYELGKKGREELEAKRRATEEAAERRRRRRRFLPFL
jgi:hypothetical protein